MSKKKKVSKKEEKKKKKRPKFDMHSDAVKSLWGVMFLVLFILSILSLSGLAGNAGDMFSNAMRSIFGWGMYVIPPIMLVAVYILFNSWKRNTYLPLLIGSFLFFSGNVAIK